MIYASAVLHNTARLAEGLPLSNACFILLPEQTTSPGPSYALPHTVAVFTLLLCCEAWASACVRFSANMATRMAASPRSSGTVGRLMLRRSQGYAAAPQGQSSGGDPRSGFWTGLVGIKGFSAWSSSCRGVHARRRRHLAIYLHKSTSLRAGPAVLPTSSLHRLAWSELKAGAASWALQAHISPAADGACDLVLGKVAASAFRVGEGSRTAVCLAPWARLCAPLWIGRDPMDRIWIGWPEVLCFQAWAGVVMSNGTRWFVSELGGTS